MKSAFSRGMFRIRRDFFEEFSGNLELPEEKAP
jgi:hypothetical protein